MAKKIIIYNQTLYAGGTLVLSALCKTLREMGYDARVMFINHFQSSPTDTFGFKSYIWKTLIKNYASYLWHKVFPKSKFLKANMLPDMPLTTMRGIKIQYNPFFSKRNSIVIYPETLYGNPLEAENVVRWLLYFHRFKDVEGAFGKNDLFVCYRDFFNDPELNPSEITLKVNYFDDQLYRQYNFGPRSGKCYILRKGKSRKDLPEHFDGPVYDDDMSQEELVEMFNEHEYCYSYDTQSFYSAIAAICGCKSVVVMEPGKTEKDYLGKGETHYGIAYGDTPEQLEYAEKTKEKLIKSLDYKDRNEANVKAFIPVLEEKFGKIKKI